MISMTAMVAVATVLVAVLAAVFTALQGLAARTQAKLLQVQLLIGLNQEWASLREDWAVSLMLANGPGGYYVRAPIEAQYTYMALRELGYLTEYAKPADEMTLPEEYREMISSLPDSDQQVQARHLTDSAEAVIEFLQRTCGRVLSGQLPVSTLYEAFGPSVVQNARPLRELAKEHRYSGYYPGMQDRVLIVIDLLWAHAIRLCDIELDHAERVSSHKRATGSGLTNRLRVRRAAARHGGRFTATRLEYSLCHAETRRNSRPRRFFRFLTGRLTPSRV